MKSEQRYLLLKRLDALSADLKIETDSLKAEVILEEMRNIGKLLKGIVRNQVPDHHFTENHQFKEYGREGYLSKQALMK